MFDVNGIRHSGASYDIVFPKPSQHRIAGQSDKEFRPPEREKVLSVVQMANQEVA
jgi:hypothetical protein